MSGGPPLHLLVEGVDGGVGLGVGLDVVAVELEGLEAEVEGLHHKPAVPKTR